MKFQFTYWDDNRFTKFTGEGMSIPEIGFKLKEFINDIEEVCNVVPICVHLRADKEHVEVNLTSFESALKEAGAGK